MRGRLRISISLRRSGSHLSSQDLIKYLTRELVQYVDTPKDERQKRKEARKTQNSSWSYHWFGVIPIAIKLLFQRKTKNRSRRKAT
ncbi:YqzE family protein [Caldalkalibacillus mannanilyticus]|uniref:YqzE family protein n=1 Tax=Caldalkalibacillus mannanilyticus TaxID=1418 RepID=UPI001F445179|nr:YqzE family protein [Caldalkalibacillus mannanilyticus]